MESPPKSICHLPLWKLASVFRIMPPERKLFESPFNFINITPLFAICIQHAHLLLHQNLHQEQNLPPSNDFQRWEAWLRADFSPSSVQFLGSKSWMIFEVISPPTWTQNGPQNQSQPHPRFFGPNFGHAFCKSWSLWGLKPANTSQDGLQNQPKRTLIMNQYIFEHLHFICFL